MAQPQCLGRGWGVRKGCLGSRNPPAVRANGSISEARWKLGEPGLCPTCEPRLKLAVGDQRCTSLGWGSLTWGPWSRRGLRNPWGRIQKASEHTPPHTHVHQYTYRYKHTLFLVLISNQNLACPSILNVSHKPQLYQYYIHVTFVPLSSIKITDI